MLQITLTNPHQEVQTIQLTPEAQPQNECSIGRLVGCDLVLNSADVSRIHGKIRWHEGTYCYRDLGSANGSQINQKTILANQTHDLKQGDRLTIGDFVLLIEAIELPKLIAGRNAQSPQNQSNGQVNSLWERGDLTVRCVRITNETEDVKTFTFMAESGLLFHYKPGQFITLDLTIKGESVLRSYSISSTPTRPHTLEITVKRVPAPPETPGTPPGLVSNWLHDNLTVGSSVKLGSPMGKFTCAPHPAAKLLLISAGSGITPMMSMSRWLMDTVSTTDVLFFHCARTPSDIIFRQELELMAARSPHFRVAISLTRTQTTGEHWFGLTGRLTDAILHTIAPDFRDRTVYVCGPDGFMQGVKTLLAGLNFPMEHYHEERFGAPKVKQPADVVPTPPASPAAAPSARPIAYFAQSTKEMTSDGTESILELAEQAGIKIRSNCRQGVCGACKKRKLEGTVHYESEPDGLDRSEQDNGMILTCVALPVDRVVVEA
jgi:ferredoxin-NADP reductase